MLDKAYGCLVGGAIGDAMGMPASFFTRKMIKETYGYIQDFLEPYEEEQHYHKDLGAGEITDDTQESIIIAETLIEKGFFDKETFNAKMKAWAVDFNILDSTIIGPSTRRFLTALVEERDPEEGARQGDTNGSAMRVFPIGVKYHQDLDLCAKAAAQSSLPSHGSAPAVASACAVAVACAAGIQGGFQPDEIMEEAIKAAQYGESVGYDITAPSVSKRIALAKEIVDRNQGQDMNLILDELVGIIGASMKSYESIPLSLGIFYAVEGRAKEGVLAAVNAGDDADTNGSICAAICGAYSGRSEFPDQWVQRVEETSGIDFQAMAEKLLG